jgi:outer membrane protein OmpA-like peptidoglycan-associated protein/tetratricopeptide (TPR) repeat protein
VLVCFCFISTSTYAQQSKLATLKKWELVDYAESAVLQKDAYSAALFYAELSRRNPNNVDYQIKCAQLELQLRNYTAALESFNQIVQKYPSSLEAQYNLVLCHIHLESYSEAEVLLKELKRKARRTKVNDAFELRLDNAFENCKYALSLVDSVSLYEINLLNEGINDKHIEINPFLLNDSTLIYGSCSEKNIHFYDNELEKPKRNFYVSELSGSKWCNGRLAEAPFFNYPDSHTGDGCFSLDKKRFYFSKSLINEQNQVKHHLFVSELKNGIWGEPRKLKGCVNSDDYSSFSPTIGTCYNPSLEVLYFVSDREGGQGGNDIWYTVYNVETGAYSVCINAGIFLNTQGTESSPYFDHSTHTLFFSSDGWCGLGGLDVFSSVGELTNWTEPENMGLGINSGYDDLDFFTSRKGNSGFFTSNRPSSIFLHHKTAFDNIYSWNTQSSKNQLVSGRIISEEYQLDFIKDKGQLQTDSVRPLSKISLNVYLKKDTSDYMFVDKIYTDSLGSFEYLVPHGHQLKLVIDNDYVLNKEIKVAAIANASVKEDIVLKTQKVKTIPKENLIVRNIYYETDKYKLNAESKSIIDHTLLKLLKEYPNLMLDVIAHTDDVGNNNYNQRLSQRRANSVVKYLEENGIEKRRLKAVGKGESEPCAITEPGHTEDDVRSQNRRTEFKLYQLNTIL